MKNSASYGDSDIKGMANPLNWGLEALQGEGEMVGML